MYNAKATVFLATLMCAVGLTICKAYTESLPWGILGPQQSQIPAAQWTKAELDKGYVVFTHSTLEGLQPDYVPARRAVVGKVSCALAQGEYKSVQIGVHSLTGGLQSVRLELESDIEARIYRPIDGETGKLLLGYENPVPASIHAACLDESSRIASIEKGSTSFFWVTLHAEENATAGKHRGKMLIRPAGRPATELDLEVTVRPFKLQRARIAYAPFFYVEWKPGALPKFAQTDEWIGAFFRDMAEHSHTSVIIHGAGFVDFSKLPPPENRYFSTLLPLAKQVGLTSPDIPIIVMDQNMQWRTQDQGGMETVEQRNAAMDWYEAERRKHGWPEIAAYGQDEPAYPHPLIRKNWEWFRDVRMRLATALSASAAYGFADFHDIWIVLGGCITQEMVAEAERIGAEVWTYICTPMSNNPLHERQYAGLYVWAYGLKGHTTWHHYDGVEYKLVWMREGDQRPMPLVGWETRREGVDDYRYLQMLEDCVAAQPGNPLAAEAKKWMAGLRARIITADPYTPNVPGKPLPLDEYDRIREKAAGYIQRLGPVPADRIPPNPPTRLKDEAKLFRGKPVQECIAGLRSTQASTRRAAAWALFEKGPEAAPAVPALTDLLDDTDVRMPALRALEAIGAQSLPALPKLTALLKHPDGFVRLGAIHALGAIGAPSIHALMQATVDDYWPAKRRAAQYMPWMAGQAALRSAMPAVLPVLIKLLDEPRLDVWPSVMWTFELIGPEAAPAVPHIIRLIQGISPDTHLRYHKYWLNALAAIGPGAAQAVPMLEEFRKDHGSSDPIAEAYALNALYRIKRSPEDLHALVALISVVGEGPRDASAALQKLEELGSEARDAAPQIRELIAQGGLSDDVKKRLEAVLDSIQYPLR